MNQNISVIIPANNSEKTLRSCLDSVMKQLCDQDELIIVDDGSTDSTAIIVSSYSKAKLIKLELNQGPARARNIGANGARNEFLIFLDSDIVLNGNEFKRVKDYFCENQEVHSLTGTLDSEKSSYNFYTDYKNLYMIYIFSQCEKRVNFIYGSFCAVRKTSFIDWPLTPRLGEDSHWGFLLSRNNKIIHLLKEISVIHLKHYDLKSLMMNDYSIAKNFAYLFLDHKRWNTLYSSEKFGHTTKNQKLSLLIAVLTLLTLPLSFKLAIVLFISWLILNAHFLNFLLEKRGPLFFLQSLLWTFCDHLIYFAGILNGFINYMGKR